MKTQINEVVQGGVCVAGTSYERRAKLCAEVFSENPDFIECIYNGVKLRLEYKRTVSKGSIYCASCGLTEADFEKITGRYLMDRDKQARWDVRIYTLTLNFCSLSLEAEAFHRRKNQQRLRRNIYESLSLKNFEIL